MKLTLLLFAIASASLIAPAVAWAQPGGASDYTIRARVAPVAGQAKSFDPEGIPVFLRAARAKGPFEPTEPKPAREWSAITGPDGVATFRAVPASIATQGLKLHAVASYDNVLFRSSAATPTPDITLEIPIYDTGGDPRVLRVPSIRMIMEPSEEHLVFSQTWTLSVQGDQALDTSLIGEAGWTDGIPIELPVKALGVQAHPSDGTTKIVNSTVHWKGVIRPNQPVSLELRYSMSINTDEFVYDQDLAYDVGQFELIIPLETRHRTKVPRLDRLALRAPEFARDDLHVGYNTPGLRPDREFVRAVRRDIPASGALRFKLEGLPYTRPWGARIAVMLGILGALGVLTYAGLSRRAAPDRDTAHLAELRAQLQQEREELVRDLASVHQEFEQGEISEHEREIESMAIRSRIGLIIHKLDGLDAA